MRPITEKQMKMITIEISHKQVLVEKVHFIGKQLNRGLCICTVHGETALFVEYFTRRNDMVKGTYCSHLYLFM